MSKKKKMNHGVIKKNKSNVPFYKRESFVAYLFMAPTIIGFTFLVAYPLLSSMYYSLCDWDGLTKPTFIGLENFRFLFFSDPIFWKSIGLTLAFVLMTVPISLVLGMALACLLNKSLPGIRIFRTIYYLPAIVPSVAAMVLWLFIYKSDYGLFNNILLAMGLPAVGWLTDKKVVLISLSIMKFWAVGGTMIIFLSGLQSVPADLYEAADIDGATRIKKFFKITLPLITPILFLQLITGMIGAFQAFNEAAIMTKGGPNYGSHFVAYDIYNNAFNYSLFGRSSAEVWILFAIIMVFTIIVFRGSEQYVYYEND